MLRQKQRWKSTTLSGVAGHFKVWKIIMHPIKMFFQKRNLCGGAVLWWHSLPAMDAFAEKSFHVCTSDGDCTLCSGCHKQIVLCVFLTRNIQRIAQSTKSGRASQIRTHNRGTTCVASLRWFKPSHNQVRLDRNYDSFNQGGWETWQTHEKIISSLK